MTNHIFALLAVAVVIFAWTPVSLYLWISESRSERKAAFRLNKERYAYHTKRVSLHRNEMKEMMRRDLQW